MAIDIERVAVPATRPESANSGASSGRELSTIDRLREKAAQFDRKKIGPRERMFFTERLSLLLETGVPLQMALVSLARQAGDGEMADLVVQLNEQVQGGSTFARALAEHPEVFPTTYVNLIAAAEVGGFLPVALDRLRDMEERQEELRGALTSALSYPAVLAVFSLAVVIFVLVVVFPKFEEIFSSIHDQLPITTRWLMAASDALRHAWLPILLASVLGLKWFSDWIKGPAGRALLDRMMLATPVLRPIMIQLNLVQMLRVVGLSLENGVGMVDSLRAAREAVSSQYFTDFISRVEAGVNEGRGLHATFNLEPTLPELVKQMIETGEESGNLPVVMARLSDFYEREWRRALGIIAKIAEPAMLVLMGGVVGLIVSSLILPIFKLSRAVH